MCVCVCVCVCSHRHNILVWLSPEKDARPANANVVAIPSKEVKKTKALFNVIETAVYWHPGTHTHTHTRLCALRLTPISLQLLSLFTAEHSLSLSCMPCTDSIYLCRVWVPLHLLSLSLSHTHTHTHTHTQQSVFRPPNESALPPCA